MVTPRKAVLARPGFCLINKIVRRFEGITPRKAVAKLVNSLKGVSSRLLRKQHPELVRRYWKGVLWSTSYFAGSCGGGSPTEIVRQYIEQQKTPD